MKEIVSSIKVGALIVKSYKSINLLFLFIFIFFMPVKSFCLGFTISERTKVYTEEITPDSLVLKIDNVFAIPVSAKLDVKIENLNVVSGSQLFAVVPANTLGFILGY